jgi:hypothetical protein
MIKEKTIRTASGYGMLFLLIVAILIGILMLALSIVDRNIPLIVLAIVILIVAPIMLGGLFVVNPNQGCVIQLFGKYVGTAKQPGLRWVNPFTTRRRVSMRVRNFESGKLKVNDRDGNPIEIAAVVVWKVVDTAEAVFEVDDYVNFVEVQSEAAVRNLATSYPYDAHVENEVALRSHTNQIAEHLKTEIQDRLDQAGVEVASATSPTRPRSPAPCSSGSKRPRSSRRARRSSREPSGWCRWPSSCSPRTRSWSSTTSARQPWSATCWSSCAAIAIRIP